nr:InlB B-repeat-containing protein [uncultured Eubacterium sp.]
MKVYYDRGKYNITYQLNGGICNNMVNSYVYGETIDLPTPRKENSVFRGWYTDASYSNRIEKIDSDVYGNITLYARWASAGDCYINDNLYMTMNGYKATFVALNDSASNIIVLYHIYDTIEEATEAYNNDSIAGYIGQELGKNNGYWSKDIDLTSYKDKYIVFAFNIISEHGTVSEKGFKKITNAPGNPDESIVVPTTKENVTTTKPAGNTTWSKVIGNDSLEYRVTAGEKKLVLIKYEAGKVYVGLNLAAKFSSVTWDDKNMTPEAGAFVNISDADLSSGRYHTLKVVDYYNKESVTILFKNTNISEETITVNETKVNQETTAELEGLIKIEGVCINTKIGGMKIVAKVTDSINNKKVTKFGLIYGLLKYNGKKTGVTSDHLKIGMEGQFVRSYNTTQKGIWKKTDNTTTYVETMTYGANSKEAYTAEYKARAYAVLEDGEIVYSNAIDYSVYEIAEQLYNNCMMPTIDGHKYLYNTILTKVTPEYTEKIYK